MSWRRRWLEFLQKSAGRKNERKLWGSDRKSEPGAPFTDPAYLRDRQTSPSIRARTMQWLSRTSGNLNLQRLLASVRGAGRPLEAETRQTMEGAFGEDLRDVRIHTDTSAHAVATKLGARAFTGGEDIYFAAGEHRPQQPEGQELLDHELAHVLQQAGTSEVSRSQIAQPSDVLEREADSAAKKAVGSRSGGEKVAQGLTRASTSGISFSPQPWDVALNNARGLSSPARDQSLANLIDRATGPGRYIVHAAIDNVGRVEDSIASGTYQEMGSVPFRINFDWRLNHKTYAGVRITGPGHTVCQPSGEVYLILGPRAFRSQGEEWTRSVVDHEMVHAMQCLTGVGGSRHDVELEAYSLEFVGHWHRLYTITNPNGPGCSVNYEMFLEMFDHYVHASPTKKAEAWQRIQIYYQTVIRPSPRHWMVFKMWLQDVLRNRPGNSLALLINALSGMGVDLVTDYLQCPIPTAGTMLPGLGFVPD